MSKTSSIVIPLTIGVVIGIGITSLVPIFIGDVEFFVRSYSIDFFTKKDTSGHPVVSLEGIVMPSWIDRNIHMSNARYIYELNFSRRHFFQTKGLWDYMRRMNCFFLVQAQTIRYRKELKLWDRFLIETRIIDWNDDDCCFYVESKFIHKETRFISAIHHLKYRIVNRNKTDPHRILPSKALEELQLIPKNSEYRSLSLLPMEDNHDFITLWESANVKNSLELNPLKKVK